MADSVKIKITGDEAEFMQKLNDVANAAQEAFSGMARSQSEMTSTMNRMASSISAMSGNLRDVSSANTIPAVGDDAEKAEKKVSKFGQAAHSAGQMLRNAFSVALGNLITRAVRGVEDFLRDSIQTGMQFSAAMSQVAAISGAAGAELELLTETAKEYGETTMFSASQAAEALNYMALAGWDTQQSVDALGGVLNLAAASGMELGAASDAVTDYLSAFGMEAGQAAYMADLMAYAQSKSNTTAAALADAYGNCASTMHAAGQDIETTTAMLMALANQGIKGSEAGTQMAAVMRDITQKMQDGKIMIGDTAVAVTDAAGNFRDLSDIVADVAAATNGLGTAEASAALMETFTARSVKAIQTLLSEGMGNVNAYEDALRGAEGTAAEQAEVMLDNLQGDVQIFKSALEGLQITASESVDGAARGFVQEATGILNALNEAGKKGGLAGMADALVAQIPALMPKAVKGVQTLFAGLGKRLPGLVKGLVSTIPDVIGGAGTIVPMLVDSLFESAGAAVEGLIGNLPSLVPALAKGVGELFVSALTGTGSLIDAAFSGMDKILRDTGMRKLTLDEVLQKKLDEVDPAKKKKLAASIEANYTLEPVTIDVEAFSKELDNAITSIRNVIDGVEGLDDDTKGKLKAAILSGSGADAISAALNELDIPETRVTEITTSLTNAFTGIQNTLSGLELDDTEIDAVIETLKKGGDIRTQLEGFGVDPETAKAAAEDLEESMKELNGGLEGLDIDSSYILDFVGEATVDKLLIALALKALKIDDTTVTDVANSYDVLDGTLAGKISGAFEALKSSLTNGISDKDDPAFAAAKKQVKEFFDEAYSVVDDWEAQKKKELEESGVTGTELETKLAAIETEAQSMRDQIGTLAEATTEWVEANAGAAGSVVKQHFDELDQLIAQVFGIDAKIKELQGSLTSGGAVNRRAVEQGLVADQSGQLGAIKYTNDELEHALSSAQDEAARALEQASADFADDAEAYAEKRREIMATLAEKEGEAYGNYDDHMQKIVASMLENSPEIAAAVEAYNNDRALADAAQKMVDGVHNAINEAGLAAARGENFDPLSYFTENAGITDTDYGAIAEKLGISTDELWAAISNSLKSGSPESFDMLTGLSEMLNPEQTLGDIFNEIDMSSVMETLGTALDEGFLQTGNDVDWTNISDVIRTGMDAVGKSVPDGLVTGMSDTSGVEAAGTAMGQAAVDSVAEGAESHSPSAATTRTGKDIVEGLAGGMSDIGSATSAGSALGSAAVNAVQNATGGARAVGSRITVGVAAGILSGRSSVISAAVQIAQAAVNAMKDSLQIHSPSRVMMRLGEYTGEGYGLGLKESLREAIGAARTVVGAANLSPRLDLSGVTEAIGAQGTVEDFAAAEYERPINLYVNGKRLAEATRKDNAAAQNRYNRSVRLGVDG